MADSFPSMRQGPLLRPKMLNSPLDPRENQPLSVLRPPQPQSPSEAATPQLPQVSVTGQGVSPGQGRLASLASEGQETQGPDPPDQTGKIQLASYYSRKHGAKNPHRVEKKLPVVTVRYEAAEGDRLISPPLIEGDAKRITTTRISPSFMRAQGGRPNSKRKSDKDCSDVLFDRQMKKVEILNKPPSKSKESPPESKERLTRPASSSGTAERPRPEVLVDPSNVKIVREQASPLRSPIVLRSGAQEEETRTTPGQEQEQHDDETRLKKRDSYVAVTTNDSQNGRPLSASKSRSDEQENLDQFVQNVNIKKFELTSISKTTPHNQNFGWSSQMVRTFKLADQGASNHSTKEAEKRQSSTKLQGSEEGRLSPNFSKKTSSVMGKTASSNPLNQYNGFDYGPPKDPTSGGITNISINRLQSNSSRPLLKQSQFHIFGVDPNETQDELITNQIEEVKKRITEDNSVQVINYQNEERMRATMTHDHIEAQNKEQLFMFGYGNTRHSQAARLAHLQPLDRQKSKSSFAQYYTTTESVTKPKLGKIRSRKRNVQLESSRRTKMSEQTKQALMQINTSQGMSIINRALPFRMSQYNFHERKTQFRELKQPKTTTNRNVNTTFIRLNQASTASLEKFNNSQLQLPLQATDHSFKDLQPDKQAGDHGLGIKIIQKMGINMQSNEAITTIRNGNVQSKEGLQSNALATTSTLRTLNENQFRSSSHLDFGVPAHVQATTLTCSPAASLLPFNCTIHGAADRAKANQSCDQPSSSKFAQIKFKNKANTHSEAPNKSAYVARIRMQQNQQNLIRNDQKYMQNVKLYQPAHIIQQRYRDHKYPQFSKKINDAQNFYSERNSYIKQQFSREELNRIQNEFSNFSSLQTSRVGIGGSLQLQGAPKHYENLQLNDMLRTQVDQKLGASNSGASLVEHEPTNDEQQELYETLKMKNHLATATISENFKKSKNDFQAMNINTIMSHQVSELEDLQSQNQSINNISIDFKVLNPRAKRTNLLNQSLYNINYDSLSPENFHRFLATESNVFNTQNASPTALSMLPWKKLKKSPKKNQGSPMDRYKRVRNFMSKYTYKQQMRKLEYEKALKMQQSVQQSGPTTIGLNIGDQDGRDDMMQMNDNYLNGKINVQTGNIKVSTPTKDDGGTKGPASNASGSPLTTTDGLSAKLNKQSYKKDSGKVSAAKLPRGKKQKSEQFKPIRQDATVKKSVFLAQHLQALENNKEDDWYNETLKNVKTTLKITEDSQDLTGKQNLNDESQNKFLEKAIYKRNEALVDPEEITYNRKNSSKSNNTVSGEKKEIDDKKMIQSSRSDIDDLSDQVSMELDEKSMSIQKRDSQLDQISQKSIPQNLTINKDLQNIQSKSAIKGHSNQQNNNNPQTTQNMNRINIKQFFNEEQMASNKVDNRRQTFQSNSISESLTTDNKGAQNENHIQSSGGHTMLNWNQHSTHNLSKQNQLSPKTTVSKEYGDQLNPKKQYTEKVKTRGEEQEELRKVLSFSEDKVTNKIQTSQYSQKSSQISKSKQTQQIKNKVQEAMNIDNNVSNSNDASDQYLPQIRNIQNSDIVQGGGELWQQQQGNIYNPLRQDSQVFISSRKTKDLLPMLIPASNDNPIQVQDLQLSEHNLRNPKHASRTVAQSFDATYYFKQFLNQTYDNMHRQIIDNIQLPGKTNKHSQSKWASPQASEELANQMQRRIRNATKQNFNKKLAKQGPLALRGSTELPDQDYRKNFNASPTYSISSGVFNNLDNNNLEANERNSLQPMKHGLHISNQVLPDLRPPVPSSLHLRTDYGNHQLRKQMQINHSKPILPQKLKKHIEVPMYDSFHLNNKIAANAPKN